MRYRVPDNMIFADGVDPKEWKRMAQGRTLCWVNFNPLTMRMTVQASKVTCKNCIKYLTPKL